MPPAQVDHFSSLLTAAFANETMLPAWLPDGLLGLLLIGFALYLPPALLLRLLEYFWVRRVSARQPKFAPFILLHAGAAAVSALFGPALCYLMGAQVLIALGYSPSSAEGRPVLLVTWWLISYAIPLQLHYTANSVLCRVGVEGRLEPKWMPWAWAATTAAAVTLAWLPIWLR